MSELVVRKPGAAGSNQEEREEQTGSSVENTQSTSRDSNRKRNDKRATWNSTKARTEYSLLVVS